MHARATAPSSGAGRQPAGRPASTRQRSRSIEAVLRSSRAWILLATLLAIALAVSAAGDKASRSTASTAAAAQVSCPTAGAHDAKGGRLYVPAKARVGRTPLLVVVVPGGSGDRNDSLGLQREARRRGLALLFPTEGGSFWSLNHKQGDGDVRTVTALLERTLEGGCFDERRISVTGVSNGAGFATRLACELTGRFAAVAPVAAGLRALDPCSSRTRTSLLAIHGTADTVVPYNGRPPARKGSVPRYAARWAKRYGCARKPRTTRPARRVARIRYRGCRNSLSVTIVRLSGTTHGWPGARRPRRGQRNPSRFNATREVVRFAWPRADADPGSIAPAATRATAALTLVRCAGASSPTSRPTASSG